MNRRRWLRSALAAAAVASPPGAVLAAPGVAPAGPVPAPQVLRRVAFGSCIDPARDQPMWEPILALRPDLFIFGGDNVYASTQPWSPAKLNAAYAQLATHSGFRRLRDSVPHLAIWDDHDYGVNDGGAEFAHKAESKEAFLNFWRAPADDARRSREGLYHAQVFGPAGRRVQVILLDVRWFRSPWRRTDQRDAPGRERYLPDDTADRQMLGEAQWQWLAAQLREPADIRLVVSGIQVVVEGHGWEAWRLFPRERERLWRTVREARAGGLVFLSGDRHIGALYRSDDGTPYPLYELTSSGMTHPWRNASEAGPNRLGPLLTDPHVGVVDIDWPARRLTLALYDAQGTARQARSISFDELQVKTP